MREELLRKVIHAKIKVVMNILEELPTPIQQSAKQMLNILQEELAAYPKKREHHEDNLKSIIIE
ncbi:MULTISPECIES: DUF3926 domain-containing protein [Bacillus]|uniref:DUF3926 domain-containing protein n=2 Tax=Bacillus cereus group TaxID=86661 RepID=A0A2A7DET7_BACAN|nr:MULTISPECIES: DUF3926 domain-containing protein [Bacillus]MCP1161777.1 DUF3926 domain-containing protein [Bacillus sp. 1813sda1]MDC7976410.1 DUF3926 domain-containing protein [Bacillus sp. BLCC-B18]OTW70177.1 hypothetical protein BK707_12560 [Bacillus thuringiensis serovar coreanensis]OTX47991.1 hypothetical protein BK724_10750 [Bacillus thuringiensis serovar sooncheon]OTX54981.1 hypothetical protein BK725_11760 [Bacillus thuringiensis serovar guiyangiensis]